MINYTDIAAAFRPQLMDFVPELTEMVRGNQNVSTVEIDYPYAVFYWRPGGYANWEMQSRYPQQFVTIPSEDPDFESDVKIDYGVDWIVTLQINIIGDTSDDIEQMAQSTERYFRNKFPDDIKTTELSDIVVNDTRQTASLDEKRGQTARRMAQRTVEVDFIVKDSYNVSVESVEQIRVAEDSELLPEKLIPEDD